jgi:hypothetical protein
METIEYRDLCDRSKWGAGAWDGEPDKKQWPDPETGLPCLAVRHPSSGHWCGYVGVAPGHPWHGLDYSADEVSAGAHGGLTFASACQEDEHGVCHVAAPGEPDHVWWFGFDCAHCGDIRPIERVFDKKYGWDSRADPDSSYKTLAYIEAECAALAKQIAAVSEPSP